MEDTNQTQPEQVLEEQVDSVEESTQVEAPQEDNATRNFKQLRELKERAERERDELIKQLQQMQQPAEEEDDIGIGADDFAEGKHLKKLNKDIKELKKQLNEYKTHSSEITTEAKIKSQYPDFDSVVTKDSIDRLRQDYPELATTINSSLDLYTKAVAAYTLIKKFGINDTSYMQDKLLATKNAAKPRPLASVSPQQGDSPLSRANAFANGLTEELKEQLRKEMYAHRKN